MRVTDALLPRLASDFKVGLAHAASVVTGFAVAYGVMQVFFGPLGDRFGKLRVIAWATGAAALASALCYFAPGFEGLLVGRIVAGAFCSCIIPLSMAWIGDEVEYERRQAVIARFLLGQIFGLASGTAVGGFAAEVEAWRWPFAALAAWFAVCAVLIAWASRSGHARKREARGHFASDALAVFAVPWARVVIAVVFVEGILVFGALAFIPTHLHLRRGLELSVAGLALLPYGLGGVTFALAVSHLVRRFGEVKLSRAGSVLMAIGFALIAWSPHIAVGALGCVVAGAGFYSLHNTLQTNATQMSPERRGAAVTLFASLFFLGQSIGVAIAGVLAERAGTTVVLLGAGLAVIPVGFTFAHLKAAHLRGA